MDGKKYGNIRMWVNNYSPSVAIELSQISVEDHYVFVGNKSSAYLTFEVRDSDLRLLKDAARALGEYLNVSKDVYQKQVEKHLAKLPTTVNVIINYPICLLKEVNEARHLELFEKLMREEPTLNEIKARCIKKLFTAVNDEAQASRLIKHIISNEYDKELIKSISNMQSNIFSDIAEGFSQLYYTQNKAQIIEFGKNVQADNFYIWNPLGNVKEKYVSYAKNTTYSSIFDWVYNSRTNNYTVHLEHDGKFRIHHIGMEFSHFGNETYHEDFYISPFETVSVYFGSRNKHINIEDATLVMPGILFAWILDQEEREANKALVDLGLTAAAFYVGGVQIVNSVSHISKTFYSLLFVKSFSDVIVKTFAPELEKLLTKKVLESYKRLSNLIDCILIFKQFADKEINEEVLMLSKAWEDVTIENKRVLKENYPEVFSLIQENINRLNK